MFLKQRTEDVDFSEAAPCGWPCPSPAENDDFVNELLSLWFCSHSCGGWKSKIKVLAGLISFEASLLGSQMAIFFWCPHKTFSLIKNISGISSSSQKELYWTRILLLGTCSTLITTLQALSQIAIISWGLRGGGVSGLQHMNGGGRKFSR